MTRLPIIATVLAAYRLAWTHFGYLVRLSAVWAVVSVVCLYVALLSFGYAAFAGGPTGRQVAFISALVMVGIGTIAQVLMTIVVEVAAYRVYLLGERRPAFTMRLQTHDRRFLLRSLVFFLVGTVAAGIIALLAAAVAPYSAIAVVVVVIGISAVTGVLLARLSPTLPAAALDDPALTLAEAFYRTEGVGWRIAAAFCAAMLPIGIVQALLREAAAFLVGPGTSLIEMALVAFIFWITGIAFAAVAAGVLSQVYVALRGDPAGVTPAPASS